MRSRPAIQSKTTWPLPYACFYAKSVIVRLNEEERYRLVQRCHDDETVADICLEASISSVTLNRRKKNHGTISIVVLAI